MSQTDLEIIIIACLVSFSCSILGCFLILRRMAMVGDAISHAVLPGIVLAYLISGDREPVMMLAGAAAFGVFTTFLIETFHRKAKLQEDAAIGVTFTSLFAIGVILVSAFAGQVDLDQECVLYGDIALSPLDRIYTSAGLDLGPSNFWTMLVVFALILLFVIISFKELFLTTFDPGYAAALGISVALWHYLLMGFVSLTTVAAFKSVGAILVVAFLVAPAATAYLLTDNFPKMLVYSCISGLISSVAGYYLALWLNASVAGGIATVCGIVFALAFFFSPSQGYLFKKIGKLHLNNRFQD